MTKLQRRTFKAGIALGFAFFLIRLAASRAFGDLLLAFAFLLAECGVVYLLENLADRMEPEIEHQKTQNKAVDQADNCVRSAQDDLVRRQVRVQEIDSAIAEIEREFEVNLELGDEKALVTIAVNAARSGYHARIAANLASVGGIPPTEAQ